MAWRDENLVGVIDALWWAGVLLFFFFLETCFSFLHVVGALNNLNNCNTSFLGSTSETSHLAAEDAGSGPFTATPAGPAAGVA